MEEISVVVCLELHASWVNDERTGSYTALYYTSGALKQLSVTHIHISINPLESNLGLVSRPRMFGMETGAHRDQTTATAMRCKRSQESWWVSSKWEEHVINIKVSGATVSRNTIANTLHRNGLKSCRSASNNLKDSFIPLQQSNLQLQFIQAASSAAEMQELHYL